MPRNLEQYYKGESEALESGMGMPIYSVDNDGNVYISGYDTGGGGGFLSNLFGGGGGNTAASGAGAGSGLGWREALALAGNVAGYFGDKKSQDKYNKWISQWGDFLSPEGVKDAMSTLSPDIYRGAFGDNPFYHAGTPRAGSYGDWADQQAGFAGIAERNPYATLFKNPGYIDPRMMNQALTMNEMGSQQSEDAAISKMGRNAHLGGLARGFSFAAEANKQRNKMGIMFNYDQARIAKTSSDMQLGGNLLTQASQMALASQQARVNTLSNQRPGPNFLQGGSNLIESGLGLGGLTQNPPPGGAQPQFGGGYMGNQQSFSSGPSGGSIPQFNSYMGGGQGAQGPYNFGTTYGFGSTNNFGQ